ncbi:MAG: VWA domain-containing protein [Anaerolineales bacterium]|nr:VWA domain-containing protein [Anaerolineales bacterium]
MAKSILPYGEAEMASRFRKHLFHILSILLALLSAGLFSGQPALAQSGIDTVVHYVEGAPSNEKIAYDVTAYVSVADSTGNPIKDLAADAFTLAEDSQQVTVLSADLAPDAPINLVLLLDTSGSMSGSGIEAAKTAASNFIAGLGNNDRVAVVTFDNDIKTRIDFTTDHRAARDELGLIDATRGAGTCLYDAAYQAVQMTATVPSGRRAVVLFTDGVDEKADGGTCSIHTADDVIRLATESGTRTPLYTLGLGSKVDQKSLQRLAQDTGGRFFYSPNTNQLDTIFVRLSDTLRSQYAIKYQSTAGPGSHTLAVTAKYLSAQDTDTRGFLLPNFPLRLTFVEPAEGQEASGITALKVETFGQGETIQSVNFVINGATVATVTTAPYEAQVDFDAYPEGGLTIDALALGAGGIELARATRQVTVRSIAVAQPTDKAQPTVEEGSESFSPKTLFFIIGGIVLVGALAAFLIVMAILKKRKEDQRNKEWDEKVGGLGEATADDFLGGSDRTMDDWEMSSDALGMLTVSSSDDSSMLDQRFEITKRRTTLGRKADNDIIFPKDSPVSRHHVVIEERDGGLFLSEVEEMDEKIGKLKRPTFGTFVNDREVDGQEVLLQNGDEIRLGKRVKLKFEASAHTLAGDEKTHDGSTSSDDTMDTRQV